MCPTILTRAPRAQALLAAVLAACIDRTEVADALAPSEAEPALRVFEYRASSWQRVIELVVAFKRLGAATIGSPPGPERPAQATGLSRPARDKRHRRQFAMIAEALAALQTTLTRVSIEQFVSYYPVCFARAVLRRVYHCPATVTPIAPSHPLLYCVGHRGLMSPNATAFFCGHTICTSCAEDLGGAGCPTCGKPLDWSRARPDTLGVRPLMAPSNLYMRRYPPLKALTCCSSAFVISTT